MSKVKAAVFASGTGSNFEAIMEAVDLPCEIVLLVCDRPGAKVVEKADKYDVSTFVFSAKDFVSKADCEAELISQLQKAEIEWIFLAGYMRLIGPTLLEAYEHKIINIHPSLLPAHPGKDGIGDAFRAGVSETGVTVHYVDAGMDTGPIIIQESVPILAEDTIDTLATRIHAVEHQLYPRAIRQLIEKK